MASNALRIPRQASPMKNQKNEAVASVRTRWDEFRDLLTTQLGDVGYEIKADVATRTVRLRRRPEGRVFIATLTPREHSEGHMPTLAAAVIRHFRSFNGAI
jgi:hypothetical protein